MAMFAHLTGQQGTAALAGGASSDSTSSGFLLGNAGIGSRERLVFRAETSPGHFAQRVMALMHREVGRS